MELGIVLKYRSNRIELGQKITVGIDGQEIEVTVLNVSFGGVLFASHDKPEIGTIVSLNKDRTGAPTGKVVRHSSEGFAVDLGQSEETAKFALSSITKNLSIDPKE